VPVIIAHRGASGYLPEHTMAAKSAAMAMNSDYIEQDVVLTKDNIPIVLHDIFLDEVTNVARKFPQRSRMYNGERRYYACDFTLEEIQSLELTERFKHGETKQKKQAVFENRFPLWKSTFRVMTLEEELQLIKGYEESYNKIHRLMDETVLPKYFGVYVELKRPDFHANENKKNFSQLVLEILNKYFLNEPESKVIIQCFDPTELSRIRSELNSKFTLVQLLDEDSIQYGVNYTYWNSLEGLEEIATFANGIGPGINQLVNVDAISGKPVASELYKKAKNLNLFMHPYTFRIDSLPKYVTSYTELLNLFLIELNVDGIFTDFPDVSVDFVNRKIMNKSNTANRLKYSYSVVSIVSILFITFIFLL